MKIQHRNPVCSLKLAKTAQQIATLANFHSCSSQEPQLGQKVLLYVLYNLDNALATWNFDELN